MGVEARKPRDEGGGRRIALLVAAFLTTGAIGLAIWSVVSTRSPALSAETQAAPESQFLEAVAATAATNEPAQSVGTVEDLLDSRFETSEDGRIELVDQSGQVVRELLYERLEPREGGRVEVTRPQAWLHLPSGALAHLEAARGSLLQPQGRREPESGRFDGDVLVRLYEMDPRTAEAAPEPSVVFSTDSLNFDTTMGELRTTDPVRINSAGVDVEFTGFTLIVDEVRQRIALFRTDSPGRATIVPDQIQSAASSDAEGSESGEAPTAAGAISENLYHAAMTGDVRIESGARRASAERLDLWARLHDNEPTEATRRGVQLLASSLRSASLKEAESTASSSSEGADQATPSDEAISITWTSGFSIEPLDHATAELEQDDTFVRLASPARGAVQVVDASNGVSTNSVGLEFAIASRRIMWSGLGPRGVVVRAEDAVEATSGRFEIDLATGDAFFPGPGVIRSLAARATDPDRPESPQQITWTDHADLSLARNDDGVDFAGQPLLRRALFVGSAQASDGGVVISGDQIQSNFALNSDDQATISRAIVTGGTRVDAGVDGVMTAQRLDIEFDLTAPDGPAPSIATAQGDVRASRAGSTLRADLAEARFAPDKTGRIAVDSFSADLGVVVRTADGVEATADALRAIPETGVVNLSGEPARISLGASAVTGDAMRLEEQARRLTVFGAGALTRTEADDSLGYESLRLEWVDSMRYDDLAGEAEFLGDCVLTADVSELARDVVTAARMNIRTQPFAPRQAGADEHPILSATAYGASGGDGGEANLARVESRRYIKDMAAEGGLRLTRLVYLDGPTIFANAVDNELHVPEPGRLLIENRELTDDSPGGPARDARGTSLIEWDGSFELRREAGAAEFRRQVRVRHRPLGAARVTELESERLEISFDPEAVEGVSEGDHALLWAQAQGAVYVAQGQRQVIADRLLYDGSLGFAELTAWPGNVVTLFDTNVPTPLAGELLRWDLLRDRVEWRGARATSAPD